VAIRERYGVLVWEATDDEGVPLPLKRLDEAVIVGPFFSAFDAEVALEALDEAAQGVIEGRVVPMFTPAEARDQAAKVLDGVGYQVPT
jgi:hypothetical protein